MLLDRGVINSGPLVALSLAGGVGYAAVAHAEGKREVARRKRRAAAASQQDKL